MTNQISRIQSLRHGLQSSVSDFTSTPGTLLPLEVTDELTTFSPRGRENIERNVRTLDGRRVSDVWGRQDISPLTVNLDMRGANANTGGAVTDWEAKQEAGLLLKSMFGAVAPATSSTASTVAASGHSSTTLQLAATTNYAAGQVVAFDTSSGFQIARIASISSPTLTFSHEYEGTPTTGATVYRLGVYSVDDDLTEHLHAFFTAEGENWRRDYFGCVPQSLMIDIPNHGVVKSTFGFTPTSWSDVAEADTAYAAPTAGDFIVGQGAKVVIAGAVYYAKNIKISVDNAAVMREMAAGTNGVLGGRCGVSGSGKQFVIECEIYADHAQAPYGLRDQDADDLTGSVATAGDPNDGQDIAVMVGQQAGALLYAYCGAANVTAKSAHSGGLMVYQVRAVGTGSLPGILAVG